MLEKLKQIYHNKIICNPTVFDYNKYYYFYLPLTDGETFGIEKSISSNEYKLLQAGYIEKKIYDNDSSAQAIYEYLFENKKYPFTKKRTRVIVIDSLILEAKELISSLFKDFNLIKLDNIYVVFSFSNFDESLEKLITTISDDLGGRLKLHDGIYITKDMDGKTLLNYLTLVKEFMSSSLENYTDLTSIIIKNDSSFNSYYKELMDKYVLNPILKDPLTKDIILTYFKNDLNASKTAKDLYINRGSLLNKFDTIYKETGINMQKFSHACAMYLLLIK